ncbi:hypothetical protein FK513_31975, partial [Klebsiella pneumoniae]|uniref:hypothetical protein n=1 Tax=Klebsiella pneumoniae TaxID=573 RepID=UPI002109BADD
YGSATLHHHFDVVGLNRNIQRMDKITSECANRIFASWSPYDVSGNTSQLAANLLYEMLCVLLSSALFSLPEAERVALGSQVVAIGAAHPPDIV